MPHGSAVPRRWFAMLDLTRQYINLASKTGMVTSAGQVLQTYAGHLYRQYIRQASTTPVRSGSFSGEKRRNWVASGLWWLQRGSFCSSVEDIAHWRTISRVEDFNVPRKDCTSDRAGQQKDISSGHTIIRLHFRQCMSQNDDKSRCQRIARTARY